MMPRISGRRLAAVNAAEREKDALRRRIATQIENGIRRGLVLEAHVARIRASVSAFDFDAMMDALEWIAIRAACRARDWDAIENVLAEHDR